MGAGRGALATRFSSAGWIGADPRWRGRDYKSAVVAFNTKPKIEAFQRAGLIDGSVASVADLLTSGPGLSSKRIGEYVGRIKDFNTSVLHAYIALMDLGGATVDVALRRMLGTFRLPGEAQCIDIIMNKFGTVYCEQNPGVLAHPDVAYVLSFSLIMLNTDLHSPSIPAAKKMTLKQWHRTNGGINQVRETGCSSNSKNEPGAHSLMRKESVGFNQLETENV